MTKKTIAAVLILFALIGGGILLHKPKVAHNTINSPLRIAFVPWIGDGIYYVARDKGFFSKENIAVDLIEVSDQTTGRQLLQTGQIDALYLTPESVAVASDAGVPVTVVAAGDRSNGADGIIATQNIRTLADLKGKTVAFEFGSTSHFLLSYLLDTVHMSTNDMTVVNNVAPDAGAAFVAGKVDAAGTWEPWLSTANERAGGHLLASSKDAPILYDIPIFRTDVVRGRTADIRSFLRASFAAREWITTNQNEAQNIIAHDLHITNADAAEQMKGVYWLSYEENIKNITNGEYSIQNAVQKAGDLWYRLGITKSNLNANQIVDPTILQTLYQ